MRIVLDDLTGPEIVNLIGEHLRNMHQLSPPESIHALGLEKLRRPDITFWAVWEESELLGCGALKELDSGTARSSMRTATAHLRKGVAP
jgi:putative acetyltransferase